ncbi:hypothetical protein DL766_000111 [Monosporascus sp. MC13-8B]|uniref:Uncharacterized protein n=1 Tax=Monosporascus cannonballus TaxID=155416 RepID=A0ABY0H5A9_9PEZI|nr:hypothetical protein DL762_005266 [Monosporascus cannonballus]RYO90433.1 hypothetical protein DL763_005353 [Monosporascus cannonballus]RYP40087.1 hypothetical protein DL766_000111 [Monosporascus sp. MC13-8B]
MEDSELDSGLLGIQLSSDAEDGADSKSAAADIESERAARVAQSEEAFQAVKNSYRVKVENGEIWSTIKLPLGPRRVSKPEAQALLHAVEELYFFRRYAEGAAFVRRVLDDGGGVPELDGDTRDLLRYYEKKCVEKDEAQKTNPNST